MASYVYKTSLVVIVIIWSQYCHAQRGEYYGLIDGVIGGTALNVGDVKEIKFTDITFKYFDSDNEDAIKIYTHGVIGIGKDTDLAREVQRECPPLSIRKSTLKFVAPYWLPVTSGEVKYLEKKNEGFVENDKDFKRMAKEINARFDSITASNIDRAVIVTWEKMQNINNKPRTQVNSNSFQAVIVILRRQNGENFNRAFALFVYKVINYQLVLKTGDSIDCSSKTYIGLGNGDAFYRFDIARFFPFRRDRVATHSNVDNFNLLGRYAYDLSLTGAKSQPFPPILICSHQDPDEKVCGVATIGGQPRQSRDSSGNRNARAVSSWSAWNNDLHGTSTTARTTVLEGTTPSIPPLNTTLPPDQTTPANSWTTPKPTDNPVVIESMTMRAAKEFCLFRKAGQYNHPIFCNLFMYCGVGGSRADVKRCPDRLNYNTILGVCDWKENLECNFPPESIVIASSGDLISPKPQVIIHQNPCLLHAWGDIPDPSSCDHYLSCTNTRTIRRPCPASLYFRPTGPNTGYCDYRYNVDCIEGVRDK